MKRPEMMPKPAVRYEYDWSEYPDTLTVSFVNGKTVKYVKEVLQPEPVLGKMLDRFGQICLGGYKYKQKGIGKRTGRILNDDKAGNGECP